PAKSRSLEGRPAFRRVLPIPALFRSRNEKLLSKPRVKCGRGINVVDVGAMHAAAHVPACVGRCQRLGRMLCSSPGLMRLAIGIVVIFASVLGGYAAMGGHLEVLWQPFEGVIILGAALGAFVIGNTGPVLKQSLSIWGTLARGPRYNKAAYVELLALQ